VSSINTAWWSRKNCTDSALQTYAAVHDKISASEVTTLWRYTNVFIIIIIIIVQVYQLSHCDPRGGIVLLAELDSQCDQLAVDRRR